MKKAKQIVMMLLASLLAQCVWAAIPTPVAHWTTLSEGATGDTAGKFTLSAGSGCTFSDGKAVVEKTTGASNTGLLVQFADADYTSKQLTILVKYSGYQAPTGNNCLVNIGWSTLNEVAYANGNGNNVGLSANVASNNGGTQNLVSPTYAMPQAGYLLMSISGINPKGSRLAFLKSSDKLYTEVANQTGHVYSDAQIHSIMIGGTVADNSKYHRPGLTIEEVTIYSSVVTADDLNADIIAKFPEVSFTKANDTDWSSKTMPTRANTAEVTANTSFAGKADYLQTLGSNKATVANVTSANSNIIYGLHAMNGNQNGLGNTTRDIYLKTSGGTFNAITGGEDATWNGTKTVLTGDTLVNIAGSTVVDYVYGAGMGGGSNVTTTGNTGVVIEGDAQVKGTIAGGWQSRHDSYPKITGNSTVLVKNVQTDGPNTTTSTGNHTVDKGLIVGGSIYWGNGGAGTIEGNSAVVVDIASGTATSTFAKKIVGGSYHKNDRKEMTVKGNSSVTITAPDTVTFNQEIIGGGHSTGSQSKVEGNSSVTINGGTYTANIYAGGNHNSAPVTGTATLTINGGVFSGAHLNAGTATGKKILNFNCDQEFAWANIAGFDEIAIADTKKLTMSVSDANVRDLTCAFTGAGTLEKTGTGTLRAIGGKEGKIAVKGGTFCIKLSAEQQVAGYAAQATIDGGTLKFLGLDNTELENESDDPTVYKMPKNAWNDTGDHSWDTAANWSYGTVPTADEIIAISTEGTIKVSSASTCQQLFINANVTLEGQIGEGKLPNIVIADGKALTINTTDASTINGVSGGTLVKEGAATLNVKPGSGSDTAVLHDMAVVIKDGKILINQPSSPEATLHDVAFTIEETACGENKVPLDNYGWFSATGPWSIETTGHARVFNNNGNNTSVIKGNGAFTKLGTGKVTILSSVGNSGNVYTGNMTVSAGELVLQPSGDGQCPNMTGTTTVNADATLTAKISSTAAANLKLVNNGTFNVDQGSVNMTAASDQSVKGTVNIAQGATLTNASNDAIAYSGSTTVNVRGTLAMGSSRWTVGGSSTINLYGGCTVTGAKTGDGSFDLYRSNEVLKVLKGSDESVTAVTIDAKIRTRNNNAKISIADGMTLAISGGIGMNASEDKVVSIVGGGKLTGELDISGIELNLGTTKNQEVQLVCSSGTTTIKLEGNNSDSIASDTKDAPFITVNSGATLNLAYNNFAGWNGGLDNGYVVNNGTLKITNLTNSSGFFRNHLILGDGVTTELNNIHSSMIIYGGAATEETAQIQLASGSATIASTVDNAKGISLSNDYNGGGFGTKGAGVTVGTDAVLTISTLFKGSEALTKYGAGKLVLSNTENTYTGSVNLKAGTIQSAKALTVATDVSGMMVVGNGSEATPYALAAVVAKIGDTPYASVQDAIDHLGEGQTITLVDTTAELPAGWTTVTKDGVVTIRQKGDVYYVSGYMGTPADPKDAAQFVAANGGTTALIDGDMIVINSTATGNEVWVASDFAGKKFSIAKNFAIHAGANQTSLLNGAVIDVVDDVTLTISQTSTQKVALGSVTINGAVSVTTDISADEIKGNCTITLADNTVLTIGMKGENVTIASGVVGKHIVKTTVEGGTQYSLAINAYTVTITAVENATAKYNDETVSGTITVNHGADVTITYVANANYKLVDAEGETVSGVCALGEVTGNVATQPNFTAVLDVTTITIPTVANMTAAVVDAEGQTIAISEANTITVTIGSTFTVTYTPAQGYCGEPVSKTYTATKDMTLDPAPDAPAIGTVKIDTKLYSTLAAANAVAQDGDTLTVLADVTLTSRIDVAKSITIDLGECTIKPTATCGNGSAFDIKSGTVTIKNGTIDGTEITQTVEDQYDYECDAITVRSGAAATLDGLTIKVNTITGSCAYPFDGATLTVLGGTYTNASTTVGPAKELGMCFNQADVTTQAVFVKGGTMSKDPALGDNSGKCTSFVAEGYISVADGANFTVAQKGAVIDPTPTDDGISISIPTDTTVVIDGTPCTTSAVVPSTTGKHTVVIKNADGKIVRADEIGVVNTKEAETTANRVTTAVAVPFKGRTVATLLNTALLNKDDTLMAWIDGGYETWTLKSDKTWEPQPMTRVGGQDSEGRDPATTALKCGAAVWVTTAGKIVTFGDLNATGDMVEVAEGHNLLGNTTYAEAEPTTAQAGDQVQLIGEANISRYNKKGDGTWESKIQTITLVNGKKVVTETRSTEAPTVKVGRGYWLIRK